MGEKGNKQTSVGQELHDQFMDQVQRLPEIHSKKMFGGYGIFSEQGMFGMVTAKGQLYLKINDALKPLLEKHQSEKHGRMPYWSVPTAVLENRDSLLHWVKLVM